MKYPKSYHTMILSALCLLISTLPAQAQKPQTSTAENPVWYHIQVLGDGDRTGRVMTELTDGGVYGRTLIDSDNTAETAAQLWRVETAENGYRFVNRKSGRYLNVRYDENRNIGMAVTDRQPCDFRISEAAAGGGSYFNIAAFRTPSGADPSETYLHQANSGGSRDYVIMMVGNDYSGSENSAFHFVEFEENRLAYSDGETTRWYRIYNAEARLDGLCLQQNTQAAAGGASFFFAGEQSDNARQEWKLVENEDGTTGFVNCATGDVINTETRTNGLLNIVQSAVAATAGTGWTLAYIGKGQYTIAGTESDGITRYLNATEETGEPDTFLPSDNHQGTGFAFRFKLTAEVPTGISGPAPANAPLKIRTENGKIYVESHSRFAIHTASGLLVNGNDRLPSGIYLVSAGGETVKVYVR